MAEKFAGMEISATGLAASAASETNIVNNSFNRVFVITEITLSKIIDIICIMHLIYIK